MKVKSLLCNHAEVQNNLLYLSGAGIDRTVAPAGSSGPVAVNVGVGISVTVPWMATNQQHVASLKMLTEDGQPVRIQTGPETIADVRADVTFTVGRPAELSMGDEQGMSLAINLPGLPLALGRYEFVVEIDGSVVDQLPYRVVAATPTIT